MNQFTEQWSVMQLAERVSAVAVELGMKASISHVCNPRVEIEEHYYNAKCSQLIDLGLEPHLLENATLAALLEDAVLHRRRARLETVAARVDWRAVPYWDVLGTHAELNGKGASGRPTGFLSVSQPSTGRSHGHCADDGTGTAAGRLLGHSARP